jgi:ABC-type branched-subunit amino acid transport system substrate-binding protein
MTFLSGVRTFRLVPSMVFAGLILASCATAPARPPVPISTGQPRPTPVEVEQPTTPDVTRPDPIDIEPVEPQVDTSRYVTPPHMRGQDVKRIGVLLPFSHSSSSVRGQASSLLAAIEMALFDQGQTDIVLLPKDTGGDFRKTQSVTREVIDEGADIIIGPLFGDNVRAAATIARTEDISVIGFSNARSAAGGGSYLMSFPPEEEVGRVVDWAVLNGITRAVSTKSESL